MQESTSSTPEPSTSLPVHVYSPGFTPVRRSRPRMIAAGGTALRSDSSGTRYVNGPNGGIVRQYSFAEALSKGRRSRKFARRLENMTTAMRSVAVV